MSHFLQMRPASPQLLPTQVVEFAINSAKATKKGQKLAPKHYYSLVILLLDAYDIFWHET